MREQRFWSWRMRTLKPFISKKKESVRNAVNGANLDYD
jgi:hypothetical protein